jgi:hypothetical protein
MSQAIFLTDCSLLLCQKSLNNIAIRHSRKVRLPGFRCVASTPTPVTCGNTFLCAVVLSSRCFQRHICCHDGLLLLVKKPGPLGVFASRETSLQDMISSPPALLKAGRVSIFEMARAFRGKAELAMWRAPG